ncbi:protein of unknown function [Cupriavidus neocaledonicus]|uniref:Uncharacterized protein n=1 Tax=Cupriavidus neocaledonicus TaxID=1040979 RepID=A0A375H9W8_9BURK|nr:protein of unknown function [Cupriavidus neocaledonicus]
MFESRTTHQYYEGPVAHVTGPFCVLCRPACPDGRGCFN